MKSSCPQTASATADDATADGLGARITATRTMSVLNGARQKPCGAQDMTFNQRRCIKTHVGSTGLKLWNRQEVSELASTQQTGWSEAQALLARNKSLGLTRSRTKLQWALQGVCAVTPCWAGIRTVKTREQREEFDGSRMVHLPGLMAAQEAKPRAIASLVLLTVFCTYVRAD
jgi:hypothetical protein